MRATCLIGAALLAVGACGGSDASSTVNTTNAADITAPTVAPEPSSTPATRPTTASTTTDVPSTAPATTAPRPDTSTISPTTSGEQVSPAVTAASIDSIISAGTVLNLAHAGGDLDAPHSTRYAFEQAVAAGANALELDVQLTRDGVLIVQHDDTVDKTTETTGPVADLMLAEIQALDNAYWFSPECWPCQDRPVDEYIHRGVRTGDVSPPEGFGPDDFRVPTFREIATAFPDLPLDIEIKGAGDAALAVAGKLATELEELGRIDSVVVVSFDDAVVDVFHALAPEVEVSPGLGRLTAWFIGETDLEPHFRVLQLPPFQGEIEVVTPDVVQRIHDEGRVIWVWANDAAAQENEPFYRGLVVAGVDGVIAGRPEAMTAAIAAS